MAGALESAALGKAVSKLYDTLEDVIKTTLSFEAVLERLRFTLAKLKPVIKEIQCSHRKLGRQEEETGGLTEQIIKSENHVRKYSKLPWWKFYKRYSYAKKLCKLDQELIRFFQLDVQAWDWRNGVETLMGVIDILARMSLADRKGGCAIPGPPDFPVRLDVPLKELKMQLLKKEVSLLLLTAPAGCGKTTLVKLLGHDEEIKGIYKEDNLFFVTVSKTPNMKVIIQTLFRHKGHQVPEFQSDEDATNKLECLLKQIEDPILLILDDVWSEDFIENFEFRIPKYKILVTSRTKFPVCKFIYELRPLNDEDSMTLFRHSANLPDTSSLIPEEDVKKIVKGCGGFPLAIKVIGRSLNGQSSEVWQKTVMRMSSGHSILNSAKALLLRLQSSIILDDEEIKNCFMDLGSFPEDQRIRVDALIDMWSELYKRKKEKADKQRKVKADDTGFEEKIKKDGVYAIANLHEIAMRNLASLVVTRKGASHEVGSYCTEDFVLQHDLLRELSIRAAKSQ